VTSPGTRHPESDTAQPIDVWIVEDDPTFHRGLKGLLERASGMTCGHAFSDAESLLAALQTYDAPPVILMDIGLPGMSGIDALRAARLISPSTSFIILTIFEDDAKVFDAICAGASGYLLKNSTGKEILQGVRHVLQGGASMSASIARRVLEMFPHSASPRVDYQLTDREKEILGQLVEGLGTKQIAARLFVSPYTIDTHLKNIYAKLHVHSGTAAVSRALRDHIV
jgi:DNA-binding NarL/FixJ family response regulator